MSEADFERKLQQIKIPFNEESKEVLKQQLLFEMRKRDTKKTSFSVVGIFNQYRLALLILLIVLTALASTFAISRSSTPTVPDTANDAIQKQIARDTAQVEQAIEINSVVGVSDGINVYKLEDGRIAMAPKDLKEFIERHDPYKSEKETATYQMNQSIDLVFHKNTQVIELIAENQNTLYIDISKL
jgi:zona occludens toxin (predicted ATPase)